MILSCCFPHVSWVLSSWEYLRHYNEKLLPLYLLASIHKFWNDSVPTHPKIFWGVYLYMVRWMPFTLFPSREKESQKCGCKLRWHVRFIQAQAERSEVSKIKNKQTKTMLHFNTEISKWASNSPVDLKLYLNDIFLIFSPRGKWRCCQERWQEEGLFLPDCVCPFQSKEETVPDTPQLLWEFVFKSTGCSHKLWRKGLTSVHLALKRRAFNYSGMISSSFRLSPIIDNIL